MNYTKEKILLKAKKVLKDLNPAYFNEGNISNVVYNEKDEVARPAGKIINTWVVIINEPVFDSLDFLVFSDITGEPLYIQSKHSIHEIKKNNNGNYY